MRRININEMVRVKLTEDGVNFIKRNKYDRHLLMPGSTEITVELWRLMRLFGDAIYMTGPQFFEKNNITLLD